LRAERSGLGVQAGRVEGGKGPTGRCPDGWPAPGPRRSSRPVWTRSARGGLWPRSAVS